MRPLEEELQRALRRREPSAGFASRVMAKIAGGGRAENPWGSFFRTPVFRWVTASIVGVLLIIGLAAHQERARQRAEAQRDSQQALLALRITGQTLNEAFARVANTGRHAPGDPPGFDSTEEEP